MWATIIKYLMQWFVVPLLVKVPYFLMTLASELYEKYKSAKIARDNIKRYKEHLDAGNEDARIDAATDMLNGVPKKD